MTRRLLESRQQLAGNAPSGGISDPNAVLNFDLPGGYTATNDFAGQFQLNQLVFNVGVEAPAAATTITGNQLYFTGAAPSITQSGFGAITISNAIQIGTNGLTFNGTGPGSVTLSNTAAITGAAATNALTFSGSIPRR